MPASLHVGAVRDGAKLLVRSGQCDGGGLDGIGLLPRSGRLKSPVYASCAFARSRCSRRKHRAPLAVCGRSRSSVSSCGR
jgi:hypothetical protein